MNDRQNKVIQEQRRELAKKALKFKQVFNSDEGQEVLEMLEEEFNPDVLFDDNPHRTAYNTGRRDVVVYIQQLLRFENEN